MQPIFINIIEIYFIIRDYYAKSGAIRMASFVRKSKSETIIAVF